ncbi:MAG: ArdC-like ssDNA-binding domain-containing protein [Phycisphaerales bacterium]
MNAEQARKLTTESLQALAADLEAGRSESLTRYLSVMARFHRYSFGNCLLILCQRPTATQVAGFHAWLRLGRHVRRGERGIAIIAPMRITRRQDADGDDKAATVLRFRVVYVFDVEQTDGDPLPELARAEGDPREATERLRAFVTARGVTLRYASDELGGALGLTNGKEIIVREGLSAAEEFTTLAHEVAHTMLHFGENRAGSRTVRELEAEAVSCVVSEAVGLSAREAARSYIQLYQGDADSLAASLERIQTAAAEILSAVLDDAGGSTTDPTAAEHADAG